MLGGDLILKSTGAGSGSHFELTIKHEPARADARAAGRRSANGSSDLNLSGLNILVVDDSQENRLLIDSILKKWGCSVDSAQNGAEGLKKMKQTGYGLV